MDVFPLPSWVVPFFPSLSIKDYTLVLSTVFGEPLEIVYLSGSKVWVYGDIPLRCERDVVIVVFVHAVELYESGNLHIFSKDSFWRDKFIQHNLVKRESIYIPIKED